MSNEIAIKENNAAVNTGILDGESRESSAIFALDIGTRSVVGMICMPNNAGSGNTAGKPGEGKLSQNISGTGAVFGVRGMEVLDYEQEYHPAQSMRDGQIEDIEMVSGVVNKVKAALEKRSGLSFNKVAVAAAGRALRTARISYEQELDGNEIITQSQIHSLEYSAVAKAQETFNIENSEAVEDEFFCVGYSVVRNTLDGYVFANLAGHKGTHVKLDVIAAFLPHNVARSLYTVTSMNGLDVDNLTLEPIAAINVIVPKDIRLLNIAIVDIGAGTSDVAISKNGSIIAYGMVTVAGDEITEALMRAYLTDFSTAESIKIAHSSGQKEIEFLDILGTKRTLSQEEVSAAIEETADNLCRTITDEILNLNETAPMAVFLVGGGSQTEGICEKVATNLNIPPDRVSIGGRQPFRNIKLCCESLLNPEYVTPIGIGLVSSFYRGCNFFSVTVNDRKVMLLNQGSIKAMDALLLAGIKPSKLIGLSSPGITYTVNGKRITKRGNPPRNGIFTVNGEHSTVDAMVRQGDVIIALPAENGEPHKITLSEIASEHKPLRVILGTEDISVPLELFVNGKPAEETYVVKEGDEVIVKCPKTIRQLLIYLKREMYSDAIYTVNKVETGLDGAIETGDVIGVKKTETAAETAETAGNDPDSLNKAGETQSRIVNVLLNGENREVKVKNGDALNFWELLNYVSIDTEKAQGTLILRLNQKEASYTDTVKDGDRAEIRWE